MRPVTAQRPEDLAALLVERVNNQDLDGVVALYSDDALLATPDGEVAAGKAEIRAHYERLLATRPVFKPEVQLPALRSGDLALTSTRIEGGGATAEVAERQAQGHWLWIIDRPNVR